MSHLGKGEPFNIFAMAQGTVAVWRPSLPAGVLRNNYHHLELHDDHIPGQVGPDKNLRSKYETNGQSNLNLWWIKGFPMVSKTAQHSETMFNRWKHAKQTHVDL